MMSTAHSWCLGCKDWNPIWAWRERIIISLSASSLLRIHLAANCHWRLRYIPFEVPSNILLRQIRPSIYFSLLIFGWGLVLSYSNIINLRSWPSWGLSRLSRASSSLASSSVWWSQAISPASLSTWPISTKETNSLFGLPFSSLWPLLLARSEDC